MFGRIVVVGELTHFVFLHFVHNLKVTQMNVQHNRIGKFMLYKFKLGHKAMEATKNICRVKDEGAVDQSTVKKVKRKIELQAP